MTTKELNGNGLAKQFNRYFGRFGVRVGEYEGKNCISVERGDEIRLFEAKALNWAQLFDEMKGYVEDG